jgi:hypothetical protein
MAFALIGPDSVDQRIKAVALLQGDGLANQSVNGHDQQH